MVSKGVWICAILSALALGVQRGDAGTCRQGTDDVATSHCGLPVTLSNFQGYYQCADAVRVGKPHNKKELADLVGHFSRVKASGIGHSWWGTQFCSGNDSDSINIVTTELDTTLNAILHPEYFNDSVRAPPDWPIQVDEKKQTVTAAAGVPQRLLLDSLADYTSASARDGYSIPAFPWYIDQTIAGAISTGTHGSSFLHGSVSSQTVRIEMALANGTLVNITEDSNPMLWHAAQVSVGRLGVITEVELAIIPQDQVERLVTTQSFDDFVDDMVTLEDDYNAAVAGESDQSLAEVLGSYEGTQFFWSVVTNSTICLSYNSLEAMAIKELAMDPSESQSDPEAEVLTSSIESPGQSRAEASASVATTPATELPLSYSKSPQRSLAPGPYLASVGPQAATPAMPPISQPAEDPVGWDALYFSFISNWLTNGTFSRRDSILAETAIINRATSDTDPYDQYEFSIPLSRIGTCMQTLRDKMYSQDLLLGFPVPALIRFVGQEDALISNANGGPRIFFNIEDHVSYQTGRVNEKFDAVVKILRDDCKARMHWGKAGWDKWANCFDGATEYGKSWCDFGCVAKSLDPNNKFASMSDVWEWRATMNGKEVPYGDCCDANGFKKACKCAQRNDCTYQPPTLGELTPRR